MSCAPHSTEIPRFQVRFQEICTRLRPNKTDIHVHSAATAGDLSAFYKIPSGGEMMSTVCMLR